MKHILSLPLFCLWDSWLFSFIYIDQENSFSKLGMNRIHQLQPPSVV